MPVNDEIFEFGKNIHAIASYYLKGENIDKMEKSLSPSELEVWSCLKNSKYFTYDVVGTEYNLAVRIGKFFFGGRLDALLKNGGNYYILDYKTGSAPKGAKYDYQTMIYTLCVKEFFKTNNVTFVYLDLRHKEEVILPFSQELEEEYKKRLIDISNKIDNYESASKKQECKRVENLDSKPNISHYPCEYSIICF